jgi:hypothetical protein
MSQFSSTDAAIEYAIKSFINDEEVLAPFISDTDWQVPQEQKT